MIYISIALVIVFAIIGYLVNKYLDFVIKQSAASNINSVSTTVDDIAAIKEQLKTFNDRINNTWANTASIKSELDGLKLAVSLKR